MSNVVKFNDVEYEVKPIDFVRGTRITSLVVKYFTRSQAVVHVLLQYNEHRDLNKFVVQLVGALGESVDSDSLEEDLIKFAHNISGIDIEILKTVDMYDFIDQLPIIVKASRISDVMSNLIKVLGASGEPVKV